MDELGRIVGQRMAVARRRRGLSQIEFAAMIGRSESWVTKVETGSIALDSLSLAQAVADMLGTSFAHLIALDVRSREQEVAPRQEQALKLTHLLVTPRDWEVWDHVQQRWFFVQAATTVMSVLDLLKHHGDAADRGELGNRLGAVRSGRGRLDAETLEGLEQTALGYRRAYRSTSAFSLLGPAYGTMNVMVELAPEAGRFQDRVVSMIGQMASLVGSMLMLDLGDYQAARSYLSVAYRAAQQLGDPELTAFVLGCRAFHSAYSGDRSGGRAFADAALDVAQRGINPVTHGWVSAVGSEMHAACAEDVECERLLDLSAASLGAADASDPWLGIGVFNADKLAAYRGGGLMRLGRYAEAQEELHVALKQLDPALAKHRCTAHVDLAEAYVHDHKLDAGVEHAISALEIVNDTRHADSLRRMETLYQAIRPTRTASARRLGETLMELKAAS